MIKLGRSASTLESLNLFSLLQGTKSRPLHDAHERSTFLAQVDEGLQRALSSESTLHGIRSQLLFETMVANFASVKLIKEEDSGDCYYAGSPVAVPDFLVVLASNARLLVEVKNHFSQDPLRPFRARAGYIAALQSYSELIQIPLRVAIYWARWNVWTLTDPALFNGTGNYVRIDFQTAMMNNEMADLGDVSIGTHYPLQLRLLASTAMPRTVEEDTVHMTIAGYEVRCAGTVITEPAEQKLALYLMMFGNWNELNSYIELDEDGLPNASVHSLEPEEKHQEQGFEIVGSLSSLFSKFYNFSTIEEEGGRVARLLRVEDPSKLAPIVPRDYKGTHLPLWRFIQQPAIRKSVDLGL